jgi:eukaryotic-like serine/threonine-protein kinase
MPHCRFQPALSGRLVCVDQLRGGSVVGDRYRLTGPVQAVRPGTVWRAIDQASGSEVAVKTLGAFPAGDQLSWARAKLALRVIAGLQYPGIAQVYDYGQVITQAGIAVPYLVREVVAGTTLEQRLGDGPLPVTEALRAVASIADALAAVHQAGLVHGNLVPANVVLGDGGVRVTDAGLWVLRDRPAEKVFPSVLSYAAPERAAGAPATPATDMYSLGVVFVACLTGITAGGGAGAPPLPALSGDSVAVGLASLWAACLGASPWDRPSAAHAAVMSRQLISSATQTAAQPAGQPTQPQPDGLEPGGLEPGGLPSAAPQPGAPRPGAARTVLPAGRSTGEPASPEAGRTGPGQAGGSTHQPRRSRGLSGSRRSAGLAGGRPGVARRGGLLALSGAATGVTVAVVLVLAQFLTSSPQPATGSAAGAPGGSHTSAPVTPGQAVPHPGPSAEATSSVPAARTSKTTPLAAINQLWRSVRGGAADGLIRSDVAQDFENLIEPVRAELIAGEPAQVASLVPALRRKLAARLGEGSITASTAQVLGTELTRLAYSARR